MKAKIFGTDGIRGRSNEFPMTPEIAFRLGAALVHQLKTLDHVQVPRIIVGKDTRLSGYLFESAFTSGICAMGGYVYLTGPLPTPGIARLLVELKMDAGVIISASHNVYSDNGIKIFTAEGFKLGDEREHDLEALIGDSAIDDQRAFDAEIGHAYRVDDAAERYVRSVVLTFPQGKSLHGMKVVLDAAHGAAYRVGPEILKRLNAEVFTIGDAPTGTNINEAVGSLHPDHCAQEVLKRGASVGIALDGDADRVLLIDELGNAVDGDAMMAICATRMLEEEKLRNRTLVATVMSNFGLEQAMQKRGARLLRSGVGDRHVLQMMREHDCNFGGETSGHLIFLDHSTTGDGLVGALQVLAVMTKTGAPLSQLSAQALQRVPQVLLSINFNKRIPLEQLPKTRQMIDALEQQLGSSGRVFVRWSGTESKLRIMVEGAEQTLVQKMADDLALCARAEIT